MAVLPRRHETRRPAGTPEATDGRWTGPWPARFNRLRFELQARYVDRLVGQTVDRLRETALSNDGVIAVVADQGQGQDGQARRVLTETNAHEIMWSTLFLRAPGLEPGMTDVNMTSIDLLPTSPSSSAPSCRGPPMATRSWPTTTARPRAPRAKVYYRFSNRWFYEPDAVLQIDSARTSTS